MIGKVTKSTGSWYNVRVEELNNVTIPCRIKGKFRLNDIKHTNPIAVGDIVEVQFENDSETGLITSIQPRKNYIIRKSSNLSKQTQIIASNIDQVLLIASLIYPQTALGFIDRFIVTAEAYHIPPIIIFNKLDLYQNELNDLLNETLSIYKSIGYTCIAVSAHTGENCNQVIELLKNKTTLVSGNSGVGKSSLLNKISPTLKLKTGEVSTFSQKGKHTTTFAEMFSLDFGGYVIDTPGIKEFGIVEIEDTEISHYFIEMRPYINQCKFNNCKHLNEPGCAVIKAVEEYKIIPERYESYIKILTKADFYE
ncbi:MAG: ribosome small subunit-dependent GTPase A [Bacteroidia bacterium]|nr:ribosome small subunit-dependent GTPase A [Bacteroidia bacterium]